MPHSVCSENEPESFRLRYSKGSDDVREMTLLVDHPTFTLPADITWIIYVRSNPSK
jgi:hypothetical protein